MATLVLERHATTCTQFGSAPSAWVGARPDAALAAADDGDLVRSARGGDRAAFDELVRRHRLRIRRVIRSRVSHPEDADDLEQDVIVKACTSLWELSNPSRFATWVSVIARHACIDYLRRRGRLTSVSMDEPGPGGEDAAACELPDTRSDPVSSAQVNELNRAYRKGLRALTAASRDAFLLRERDGLSMEEIAARIDGSVGSAKSLIYRARRKLEDSLQPYLAA
ncbi:MAG TPA: RNA polymerase sigma factor [Armatimonadota bacterium]|nr:RNA polymerase sigma factor [Armatimonadota bacterium]